MSKTKRGKITRTERKRRSGRGGWKEKQVRRQEETMNPMNLHTWLQEPVQENMKLVENQFTEQKRNNAALLATLHIHEVVSKAAKVTACRSPEYQEIERDRER